jgi:predicted ferric reductase
MAKENSPGTLQKQIKVKLCGVLVVVLCTIFTCVVLTIPFVYETQTIWYKVGIDRTLLRGGQLAGLLATVLLFIQILLGVRSKFLQGLFGIARLMQWHRINGVSVALLALSHALLVLIPEGMTNLPIGKKHWPEMVGGVLLLLLLFMAFSSHFRQKLALNYPRWKTIHKLLGYFILSFIAFHVLFVSESFQHGIPKGVFLASLFGVIGSVLLTKRAEKRLKLKSGR